MVTGPTLTDDHVLGIITSILSRSDLQQPTRLTFEEFTNVSHVSVFVAAEESIGTLRFDNIAMPRMSIKSEIIFYL